MRHVFLTCINHPHLRWMCKEIAVNGLGQYNGARNIFYLGTKVEGKDVLHSEFKERECSCSPRNLRFAPECEPRFPVPAISTRVEHVFGYGLADGIFVRVDGYIVAGAYADGMSI